MDKEKKNEGLIMNVEVDIEHATEKLEKLKSLLIEIKSLVNEVFQ